MWWTRRAVGFHVTLAVVVPAFIALFWWQVQRVRQGNTLSWAYVFEWPFFAGYAVYLWWKLVHDQPQSEPDAVSWGAGGGAGCQEESPPSDRGMPGARTADSERDPLGEELEAYNRYLAGLHEAGRRKTW